MRGACTFRQDRGRTGQPARGTAASRGLGPRAVGRRGLPGAHASPGCHRAHQDHLRRLPSTCSRRRYGRSWRPKSCAWPDSRWARSPDRSRPMTFWRDLQPLLHREMIQIRSLVSPLSDVHESRQGPSLRQRDHGFYIPLLPRKGIDPVRSLDLRSVSVHRLQSSARVQHDACRFCPPGRSAESLQLRAAFIDTRRHELRIPVGTAPLDFPVGDRTGNDCRIGQHEPAARFQQSGHLVKEGLGGRADAAPHPGRSPRRTTDRQGESPVQVRQQESDPVLNAGGRSSCAPCLDRRCAHIHSGARAAGRLDREDQRPHGPQPTSRSLLAAVRTVAQGRSAAQRRSPRMLAMSSPCASERSCLINGASNAA